MDSVRINIRRLITSILVSLVLPLALAILLDHSLGWTPLATIGASLFFIPLSTVIVTRAALSELDQIIQRVAPLDLDPGVTPALILEKPSFNDNVIGMKSKATNREAKLESGQDSSLSSNADSILSSVPSSIPGSISEQ